MVAIIIPVLNEEKTIEKCLQNIIELPGQKELIVVDGGSLDNTVEIASRYARVITSPKGNYVTLFGISLVRRMSEKGCFLNSSNFNLFSCLEDDFA